MSALLLALVAAPVWQDAAAHAPPTELFEVTRVVDGDTLWIERGGEVEKLRLLSVDTEERITGRPSTSTTKPETVFGEECALWAQEFFAELAPQGERPRIGLLFPGGVEERGTYGRLLCHVILPDGRDFNLLLVELGKSPYFNKYGNSRVLHDEFVAAQRRARAARRGIWDPATNTPADPAAPAAKRPYDRLLPWWDARAAALEGYRSARRAAPDAVSPACAEVPADLERALAACAADPAATVEVFCTVERFFDEDDGSVTALFRAGDRRRALRASLDPARDAELLAFLRESTQEFRQNYLTAIGRIERGPRGFRIVSDGPSAWRPAGPDVATPRQQR